MNNNDSKSSHNGKGSPKDFAEKKSKEGRPFQGSQDDKPGQGDAHDSGKIKCSSCRFPQIEQYIGYIVLILGLIILFFHQFIGGLLIGIVAGYFFSKEIVPYLRSLQHLFREPIRTQNVILTGTLLGVLICAPGIIIGAFIVAVLKQVIVESST